MQPSALILVRGANIRYYARGSTSRELYRSRTAKSPIYERRFSMEEELGKGKNLNGWVAVIALVVAFILGIIAAGM